MTSDDSTSDENFSVSIPVGAAVTAVLLAGAAAAAYLIIGRADTEGTAAQASSATRSGKSMFRRLGIMGLVTLIENDATRKVVVAVLKAMARRS